MLFVPASVEISFLDNVYQFLPRKYLLEQLLVRSEPF